MLKIILANKNELEKFVPIFTIVEIFSEGMLLISRIHPFCINKAPKNYKTKPGSIFTKWVEHKSVVKNTNLDTSIVWHLHVNINRLTQKIGWMWSRCKISSLDMKWKSRRLSLVWLQTKQNSPCLFFRCHTETTARQKTCNYKSGRALWACQTAEQKQSAFSQCRHNQPQLNFFTAGAYGNLSRTNGNEPHKRLVTRFVLFVLSFSVSLCVIH